MEPQIIKEKIALEDTQALLFAYKRHLAGKPVEELELDPWQREVFCAISRGVASGKTAAQISQDTGYTSALCCDFRRLRKEFHKNIKIAKNFSTKKGQEAILKIRREYGVNVNVPQKKSFLEAFKMSLAGEKISHVPGIPDATVKKVRVFLKMCEQKATVEEMSVALGIPEKDIGKMLKMLKIKKRKESLARVL